MARLSQRAGGDLLVAKRSAAVFVDGTRHLIRRNMTVVREGHPILRGREHLFGPLNIHFDTADAPAKPERAPAPVPAVTEATAAAQQPPATEDATAEATASPGLSDAATDADTDGATTQTTGRSWRSRKADVEQPAGEPETAEE